MDAKIKQLLKQLNIRLEFAPLHCPGLLVPGKNGKPNVMIINSSFADDQIENVILHELGHALNDKNVQGNYRCDDCAHTQSEYGANGFLIHEKVKQYFALGNDYASANWLNIAKSIGTQDYLQVQEELNRYRLQE